MKTKNLVSLSVAAVFFVLSITGLLIYLGQNNNIIDHTHAWFGVLFFSAAVFHIVNNWSSLKNYTTDRKAGGLRREFVLPTLLVVLFAVGIAADWPVFKDLANAGKRAFGKPRPEPKQLSEAAIDSLARPLLATSLRADAAIIRFEKATPLTEAILLTEGTARHTAPADTATFRYMAVLTRAERKRGEGEEGQKKPEPGWEVKALQTAPLRP